MPNEADAANAEPEVEIVEASTRSPEHRRAAEHERDAGDEYGAKVRKRINGLTGRLRTEESARMASEAEAAQLRAQLAAERAGRYGERERTLSSDLTAAEGDLARAITEGDGAKQASANRKLAELSAERSQVSAGKVHAENLKAQAEQQAKTVPQPGSGVSPAVQDWIDNGNDWFLTNEDMQRDALAQHQVALGKGLKADSPAYFDFIDERMRKLHPDAFEGGGERTEEAARPAARAAVAPAAGARRVVPAASAAAPRRVQLTSDEMDVCKALKITPQEYAAQRDAMNKKDR